METEVSIDQLLRWRLAHAEAESPIPPCAARLLEMARPWWERYPERFMSLRNSLMKVEVGVGHSMAESSPMCAGHPVPALLVRADEQLEAVVRVLHFSVRDHELHFHFRVESSADLAEQSFEVTFVANSPVQPLFTARATRSVESEYRMDGEVSSEITGAWEHLKVTDRIPFRLVLRAATEDA